MRRRGARLFETVAKTPRCSLRAAMAADLEVPRSSRHARAPIHDGSIKIGTDRDLQAAIHVFVRCALDEKGGMPSDAARVAFEGRGGVCWKFDRPCQADVVTLLNGACLAQ